MNSSDFVHLHLHTEYSLLDGAGRIDELVAKAARLKMPALAITDHGNMHGVIKFYQQALVGGVKPIIGCELYVAPGGRRERKPGSQKETSHLTCLARDEAGYHNLIKLSSRAYLEGFYYKPRIDRELLEAHHEGLIALSGCLKGEIPRALVAGDSEKAEETARYYRDLFGPDNFYLELMDHGIKEEREIRSRMVELARRLEIGLVATNDCHYLDREDAESQEVLLCLQTGRRLDDPNRMRMSTDEFYLKSVQEMEALFPDLPEAIRNTREIADRCHLELQFGRDLMPVFETPPGKTPEVYLRDLCYAGIPGRYGRMTDQIKERLEFELKVIVQKNFPSYFLIVWDLIRQAKSEKIPVGPGRGSAAGSIVAYLLGITDIDPFRFDLLFERFLNPTRMVMPDIDMDICDQRRGELIRYASRKYGPDHVSQIITFGSMKARAVLRDVGRVLGIAYGEVDRIAKLVPPGPKMTLKRAVKLEPRLEEIYRKDPVLTKLFKISFRLEGISRHASTHAAGVLISRQPLIDNIPLCRGSNDEVITQYDMHDSEAVGLLKMDFLGLKTLSVIQDTIDLVEKTRGEKLEISRIPTDDPETFELLSKANTIGVFQLESSGMRDLTHRIGLKKFEDILALVALFRPGPMHMLEDFVSRKHGKVKIRYDHPLLEPILKDTYGVMLYQEQVMRIAHQLAGFTLAKADVLRKAMGKKQRGKMAQLGEAFIEGAARKGVKRALAEKIFSDMSRFAEYGFNKSHSAAYALIAYRTAYLKVHYPRQYMASLLTSEMRNMDKLVSYMAECSEMGIKVLPPDINESFSKFTVVGENIRFGLTAIKNVGQGAVESIVAARRDGGQFKGFYELLDRVSLFAVNKKVIESLNRCGALDSLPGNRAQKMAVLDRAIDIAARRQKDRSRGQGSLFDRLEGEGTGDIENFPEMEEWSQSELLSQEKELMGMYITGHPLSQYEKMLKIYASHSIKQLAGLPDRSRVLIGGIINQVEEKSSRRTGKKFAVCQVEDLTGTSEVVIWGKAYQQFADLLKEGGLIFVEGSVNSRDYGSSIRADQIFPLTSAREKLAKALHINVHLAGTDVEAISRLGKLLSGQKGSCPVFLDFDFATGEKVLIRAGDQLKVTCTPVLLDEVEKILGEDTVYVKT